jgi:hypothetical protein
MAASIVGTWKLVRATAKDAGGATLAEPYGGKGIGRVVFTAGGRMQAVVDLAAHFRRVEAPSAFCPHAHPPSGHRSSTVCRPRPKWLRINTNSRTGQRIVSMRCSGMECSA